MKMAEALMLRSDLQKKLESLKVRVESNATKPEGKNAVEDPTELLKEAQETIQEISKLVSCINRTNVQYTLADGTTLATALEERDQLKRLHSIISAALNAAQPKDRVFDNGNNHFEPAFDLKAFRRQAAEVAQRIRERNAVIQQANWTVEMAT